MINDLDVLNDIKSYIIRLLEIGRQYPLSLSETYLLQAKLALLTFEIKNARRLLTQAQFLAEKHGLNKLAMKISNEHDDLLKQQIVWDNLKENKSSFAERMNLAKLSEQMDNMLHKHAIETPNLISEEPIFLLINAHGGITAFSKIFTETLDVESDLIGGYLTAINQFGDEIFSEGLDRAKYGEYIVLMKSVDTFLVCYLFKGQSFLAKQKLAYFAD